MNSVYLKIGRVPLAQAGFGGLAVCVCLVTPKKQRRGSNALFDGRQQRGYVVDGWDGHGGILESKQGRD